MMAASFRQKLGALLLDRPLAAWPIFFPRIGRLLGKSWLSFRNRDEQLIESPMGSAFSCNWRWSTDLNVCRTWPAIARRLFRCATDEWPIRLTSNDATSQTLPEVSFIIGHHGAERIPHLMATVRSILAQTDAKVECLVVEQSNQSLLPGRLPSAVRLVSSPPPDPSMPYSRSWAFNVGGASSARICSGLS